MRVRKANDTFIIGFMIGATIPVLGYWCIENIFTLLTEGGIMDEVTTSTFTKRIKTLTLLSVCTNLIPAQLASNKYYTQVVKGIILATMIYAGCWILYFFLGFKP